MGTDPRRTGESLDDEPSYQAVRVDTKKKSLGATERNEEERAVWRENASKLPTESLVFLDECGSNIALTPCMPARQRENAPEEVFRATAARTQHSSLPFLWTAWELR